MWLVRLLVVPELQVFALFADVYEPFFFCRRNEIQLERVDLLNQLVRNLFLVEGDEEFRVRLDLLMEKLNNILRDKFCQEAQFEALPEVDHDVVEVERVRIFLSFLVGMLGLRNHLLDTRAIKRVVEDLVSLDIYNADQSSQLLKSRLLHHSLNQALVKHSLILFCLLRYHRISANLFIVLALRLRRHGRCLLVFLTYC